MTRISRSHPRYASLKVRARLAEAHRSGLVVPEGLIAHGRAEAFDYLLGERTSPSARRAARVAAQWLRAARHPVVSVNGNVAALAADGIAGLQRALPSLGVEVNLFHRSPARVRAVARTLEVHGVRGVMGVRATGRIPGLPSDRAVVDRRGILAADVVLVPLEDGDRTAALRRAGKRVIAIDLNPLSRTSRTADLPIIDELTRALAQIVLGMRRRSGPRRPQPGAFAPFDARAAREASLRTIARRLVRNAPNRGRPVPRAR
ncbi:MAG TPA: phosphopantothenate/pantothenate synthetase [Thermoplasmata archaeon]|nr:phosphopantothenate/pantothenate synthetase [Thermoplasmata archaeon]